MTEYRGYKIEGDGTFGYKHIKPTGKGSVSLELRGAYTSGPEAQKAIDNFLTNKEGKTNGSTKSTS